MGQQLAVPTGFNNTSDEFVFPPWYNHHFEVRPATIVDCQNTLAAFTNGDHDIYLRIKKFDLNSTPLDFLFRQLFLRLFIVSPTFTRKLLKLDQAGNKDVHETDMRQSRCANSFFNDILMESCNRLSSCTTSEQLDDTYKSLMIYYNTNYGIDAYLFTDIGTVILFVLSDCIGASFVQMCQSWIDFLSKGLKTLIDLNLTTNEYGSFSLRETMIKLNQPYIEWSDGILSTGYFPIDRQHHWLLTIINVLIHINSGNQVQINTGDVLSALSDYAWIHFTEEEDLFMNNPNYPQGVTHKKQHEEFLQKLQEFKTELQTQDAKIVNKELLDYSIAWLTNHIRVTDRKMINCCISPEVLQNNVSMYLPKNP